MPLEGRLAVRQGVEHLFYGGLLRVTAPAAAPLRRMQVGEEAGRRRSTRLRLKQSVRTSLLSLANFFLVRRVIFPQC